MSTESSPTPEPVKITDEQVIEALRAGPYKPETQEALKDWCIALEKELDAVYESAGSGKAAMASIALGMRRATVYYKAGYTHEAVADLEETVDAASSNFFKGTEFEKMSIALLERMKVGEVLP
jgi:hypothetical protein